LEGGKIQKKKPGSQSDNEWAEKKIDLSKKKPRATGEGGLEDRNMCGQTTGRGEGIGTGAVNRGHWGT